MPLLARPLAITYTMPLPTNDIRTRKGRKPPPTQGDEPAQPGPSPRREVPVYVPDHHPRPEPEGTP